MEQAGFSGKVVIEGRSSPGVDLPRDDQSRKIRKLLKKQDVVIARLDHLIAEIEAALKAAAPSIPASPDDGDAVAA